MSLNNWTVYADAAGTSTAIATGTGNQHFLWYGTENGQFLPTGQYTIRVVAGTQSATDPDGVTQSAPIGTSYVTPANTLSPYYGWTGHFDDIEWTGARTIPPVSGYVWPYNDYPDPVDPTKTRRGLVTHVMKHYTEYFSGADISNPSYIRCYFNIACEQLRDTAQGVSGFETCNTRPRDGAITTFNNTNNNFTVQFYDGRLSTLYKYNHADFLADCR